ncbi:alkaline phosphatase D family protein [Nocardioides sp.]|uniref:alkaline phosphatase D family protein n=1 Tax=Nocardioides sp. TaxID=35761 RepID=UPI002BD31AB6|nr:alkaline phosphatase D family protein [Nocardioides sp.]HXH81190.1 alkaline phosphatase D family protein [Nocardioides sp.]
MNGLRLGPLLRYVDDTSASVWVETEATATVRVARGAVTATARTFAVHDHHYALVELHGLEPGSRADYTVSIDGEQVWPEDDAATSVIATLKPGKPLRMAFGSCRTSVGHDAAGVKSHGVDALRSYALRMSDAVPVGAEHQEDRDLTDPRWPDLLLLLGDQVYADETTKEMREFIAARRDIEEPPWEELKDFGEYAHLYSLAWSDTTNRWLLSTLPSAMMFDDHDIRDDWNTSQAWRDEMQATSWWHGRIVSGLASYWVYQHLGNLSPTERREDEIYRLVLAHEGPDELDLSDVLDAFADRVDREPASYRWSYCRDFDTQARLVVVDSRAARVLEPSQRALLDPDELAWLDERMRGDVDHLLIGTSLPFMLARGLHHVESFSEALAEGTWGPRGAKMGEKLRQTVDLEHWAAFQKSFAAVSDMAIEVASGKRGRPPVSVTFLGGDVHHSYVSEARLSRRRARAGDPLRSAVLQAVCSPIRNPLSPRMRFVTAALSYGVAGPLGRIVSKSTKVPDGPLRWTYAKGPWFDNNLACLELEPAGVRMWWVKGEVVDDPSLPQLVKVADYRLGD